MILARTRSGIQKDEWSKMVGDDRCNVTCVLLLLAKPTSLSIYFVTGITARVRSNNGFASLCGSRALRRFCHSETGPGIAAILRSGS